MTSNILELTDYDFSDKGVVKRLLVFSDEDKINIDKLIIKQTQSRVFDSEQQMVSFHSNLISVAKHFTYAIELEIVDYCHLSDSNIFELGAKFLANIIVLTLDGCEALTCKSFNFFSKTCVSLVGLTFICPNNSRIFLNIHTDNLVLLVKNNKMLRFLSIMIFEIDLTGLSAIIDCGHIVGLMLNIYSCDEFTKSAHFLEIVIKLLGNSLYNEIAFYLNSEEIGSFNIETGSLVLCVENLNPPPVFQELLEDVFLQRSQIIQAVSFAGINCLCHAALVCLVTTNGDSLRDIMISNCGHGVLKLSVALLFLLAENVKLVFIRNGSESLGSSGQCYLMGGRGVLALLNRGEKFSHSVLADVRDIIYPEDYDFLHSNYSGAEYVRRVPMTVGGNSDLSEQLKKQKQDKEDFYETPVKRRRK
jgi:hypothetical protein